MDEKFYLMIGLGIVMVLGLGIWYGVSTGQAYQSISKQFTMQAETATVVKANGVSYKVMPVKLTRDGFDLYLSYNGKETTLRWKAGSNYARFVDGMRIETKDITTFLKTGTGTFWLSKDTGTTTTTTTAATCGNSGQPCCTTGTYKCVSGLDCINMVCNAPTGTTITTTTPTTPVAPACTDSDGDNPGVLGKVRNNNINYTDYCANSNMLYEYYCISNISESIKVYEGKGLGCAQTQVAVCTNGTISCQICGEHCTPPCKNASTGSEYCFGSEEVTSIGGTPVCSDGMDDCNLGTTPAVQCGALNQTCCTSSAGYNCSAGLTCNATTTKCQTTQATCTVEWKCKNNTYMGITQSNCQWEQLTFCQYGCANGLCSNPPCSAGYGCKDANTWAFKNETCAWSNLITCQYGCAKSGCNTAPTCSENVTYVNQQVGTLPRLDILCNCSYNTTLLSYLQTESGEASAATCPYIIQFMENGAINSLCVNSDFTFVASGCNSTLRFTNFNNVTETVTMTLKAVKN